MRRATAASPHHCSFTAAIAAAAFTHSVHVLIWQLTDAVWRLMLLRTLLLLLMMMIVQDHQQQQSLQGFAQFANGYCDRCLAVSASIHQLCTPAALLLHTSLVFAAVVAVSERKTV
jgi:hypothetical protein